MLFEKTWSEAYPLRHRSTSADAPAPVADGDLSIDHLSPIDAKILDLLLAGLSDRAVATKIGMSLRTVTRRIRLMMDLAGADNRIQLGWRATQHGWI